MRWVIVFVLLMYSYTVFSFESKAVADADATFTTTAISDSTETSNNKLLQLWNSIWNSSRSIAEEQTGAVELKSGQITKWESVGPSIRPRGDDSSIGVGRIVSLWVNPLNYDHILAGASTGGLWKTTDLGKNWECLTNNYAVGGVCDIAVDPKDEQIIYIASKLSMNGSLKYSGLYSMGIFKSIDGGKTWVNLPIDREIKEYFEQVKIDPENRFHLYALSNKTVYKSSDSGKSWKKTTLRVPNNVDLSNLRFKPGESKTIYVSGINGLYVTTNGGKNWNSVKDNLTSGFLNSRISISINPANSDELYAFYNDLDKFNWESTPNRIEKTSDGGKTWKLVTDRNLTAVRFTCEICLSPRGDIYAGGMNLKKSTDGGNKFTTLIRNSIHPDIQEIVFPDTSNNNLIYVANDGGVFIDSTGGENWTRINGNLTTNEFYGVDITESNPEIMIGGTHDCGSYYRDSLGVWEYVMGGDGGTSLFDHQDPRIFYLTSNMSVTRFTGKKRFVVSKIGDYDAPFVLDPTNSDVVYCHQWVKGDTPPVHIKKSTNKGETWSTLEQEWNNLTDITISFSNPNYIYYSMWDSWAPSKIKRSTDGGETWTNANHSDINRICAEAPVTGLLVDPFNPLKLWAVFGGFEANEKIFFSENGGDSWQNISGKLLPNVPVECLQYDYINQTIYLGTDMGLYQKKLSDEEWQYCFGFPRAVVSSIKLNKSNGDLVVSTYGRGIWRTNLGAGYCYDSLGVEIDAVAEWTEDMSVCGDLIVKSGGELTIKSALKMPYHSTIVVQPNATLVIDSVTIITGNVIVEEGGRLSLENGGQLNQIYGK